MEDIDASLQTFHNGVRDNVIFLLLFLLLWFISLAIFKAYAKIREENYINDYEEELIYNIVKGLCCFSFSVSLGAALLLPISIVSNEVLLLYPNSSYIEWLNSSLIHKLWNHIFLFHNLCLFMLLPFAYFLTESEGLPGSRKGLAARFTETCIILFLLACIVLGMSYTLSSFFEFDLQTSLSLNWLPLPFIYSCISLFGAILLLVCTPVGFARLFTVVGELIIKPKFLRDIMEEFYAAKFEEDQLKKKLSITQEALEKKEKQFHKQTITASANGISSLFQRLHHVEHQRKELESQCKVSPLRRNIGYPAVMLLLLAFTSLAVLMVTRNTLELLVGVKSLPMAQVQTFKLGISSLSVLGSFGASLEIVLILYLWMASIVGFYSLPWLCRLRPYLGQTAMTHMLGNCAVLLVLTSALPLLARTLGITDFDLLGNYGRIEWLGNFYLVLFYNIVFAVATALCLFTKFTAAVRQELLHCFRALTHRTLHWPAKWWHNRLN